MMGENGHREGCAFCVGASEISVTCIPQNCINILKVWNSLIKSVYFVPDYTICSVVVVVVVVEEEEEETCEVESHAA
jgi:hypothetical protein